MCFVQYRWEQFGALRKHPKPLAQELCVQWINAQHERGNSSERELHESVYSFICHLGLEHVFVSDRVTNGDRFEDSITKMQDMLLIIH
jgi:hypothetical protein